jgi:predicted RND superfamily exporter protein
VTETPVAPRRVFGRIAVWVLEHRRATVLLLLMVYAAVLAGGVRLQVDFSARAFFGTDDPAAATLDRFVEEWGTDDGTLLVLVDGQGRDLLRPDRLELIEEIGGAIEALPGVAEVLSISTVPYLHSPAEGHLISAPLRETLPVGEGGAAARVEGRTAWRDRLLATSQLVPTLLSPDGHIAAMLVDFDIDTDDIGELRPVVFAVNEVLEEHDGRLEMRFLGAGVPAIRANMIHSIQRDQLILAPASLLLMGALLLLLFRCWHGVLIPVVSAGSPALLLLGILGWTGEPIGLINQVYLVLIPVIAVADSIHLVSRFHEEARRLEPGVRRIDADLRRRALVRSADAIGLACLLTTATTVVGFLSLMAARMTILRSFGGYAAVGLTLAYLGVLIQIPLMLSTVRSIPRKRRSRSGFNPVDQILLRCANVSISRPSRILALVALGCGLCVALGSRVVVDNWLTGSLPVDDPAVRANVLADGELAGVISLQFDLEGPMDDPELLRALHGLEVLAGEQPHLRAVRSPATFVALAHDFLFGERRIPEGGRRIQRLLLVLEGEDLMSELMSLDRSRGRIQMHTVDPGGRAFERLATELQLRVQEALEGLPVELRMTGTPYVAYRGINHLTTDLRNSLLLAFGLIALILGMLFGSLRILGLALVPNALPLLGGYALMGLTGWILDPMPAVLFTVALAIAVDDTIHLLVRYREERRLGVGLDEAIRDSVLHTGRAVVVTSIILMGGFFVDSFASFPANAIFGRLGVAVIFVALLCDLFVLPALLVRFGRR